MKSPPKLRFDPNLAKVRWFNPGALAKPSSGMGGGRRRSRRRSSTKEDQRLIRPMKPGDAPPMDKAISINQVNSWTPLQMWCVVCHSRILRLVRCFALCALCCVLLLG